MEEYTIAPKGLLYLQKLEELAEEYGFDDNGRLKGAGANKLKKFSEELAGGALKDINDTNN